MKDATSPVVWVDNHSACIALTHVQIVIPEATK